MLCSALLCLQAVDTQRMREGIRLSSERNRIMRLELLLTFGATSLALSAAVAGFFGMNLHSGIDEAPQLMWAVSAAASAASALLFVALYRGVRRFHAEQAREASA